MSKLKTISIKNLKCKNVIRLKKGTENISQC